VDIDIPIVDLTQYLKSGVDENACKDVTRAMEEYGILILRDPRVNPSLPNRYRAMMEQFYRLTPEVKARYIQPTLPNGKQIYETGWRPPFTEKPRRRAEVLHLIAPDMMPPEPPTADPKERFMDPVGPRPENSEFPELDYLPNITPVEIEDFRTLSDAWGDAMRGALMTSMEMLAIGFGEPADLFTSRLNGGIVKLAPTGLDLSKHGAAGTVAAGFHNDLSAVTIHGRSNYSGLWCYRRDWTRFPARMPSDEYLLLQCGRTLEHFTAGRTSRGYHYVQIGEESQDKIRAELDQGTYPWRVSTTMFANTRTSEWLEPIGRFVNEPAAEHYHAQRVRCGTRMMKTLTDKVVKAA